MNIKTFNWYVDKALEVAQMFALCFGGVAFFLFLAMIS